MNEEINKESKTYFDVCMSDGLEVYNTKYNPDTQSYNLRDGIYYFSHFDKEKFTRVFKKAGE